VNRLFAALFLGCGLTLAVGCGDGGPKVYHLSGNVTMGGKPVPAGEMFLGPDLKKGVDGPQGFAFIKAGKYDTRDGGRGMIGGPLEVTIRPHDGIPGSELPMGKKLGPDFVTTFEAPKADSTKDFEIPRAAGR